MQSAHACPYLVARLSSTPTPSRPPLLALTVYWSCSLTSHRLDENDDDIGIDIGVDVGIGIGIGIGIDGGETPPNTHPPTTRKDTCR